MPSPNKIRALALGAAVACSAPAFATTAFDTQSPWMLGDWGGLRTQLHDQGVDFQLNYLSEGAANLRGGYSGHHTARYADQWSLGATFDLHKLLGWQDAQAQVQFSDRNGRSLDDDALNDPRAGGFASTQQIHGRGSVTRITELWLSKGWFNDRLNVKAGRFTVSDEFAVQDCLFQNLAFCGSQPGNYVSDIYNSPTSSWALRIKYRLADQLAAQVASYNVNPSGLDNDNALKLRTHGTTGMLLPAELIWAPQVNRLPGEYRLGYYYNTANHADVYHDANGNAAALTGDNYRSQDSRHGGWMTAKQQLTAPGGDASRGLVLYASATFHDRATNPVDSYQHASLVYKGPFAARPHDTLGVGLARIHASSQYLRNAQLENDASGLGYSDAGYVPEQHTAYMAELNYGIQATGWLNLMPNLQYVRNPGGVRQVDNAVVLGLQAAASF
ncbi:carbohydrate porin [Pseudomonas sp. NPDC007930]|uniref:carbohydrate porin n=1 Tax=Pseudomonas sp. NPDC007930 TaxID=3364417 RepID=UPI0036E01418